MKNPKTRLSLDDKVYKCLSALAKFRGVTIEQLIVELLNNIDDYEQDEVGMFEYLSNT